VYIFISGIQYVWHACTCLFIMQLNEEEAKNAGLCPKVSSLEAKVTDLSNKVAKIYTKYKHV
jgi:hypothetical protein